MKFSSGIFGAGNLGKSRENKYIIAHQIQKVSVHVFIFEISPSSQQSHLTRKFNLCLHLEILNEIDTDFSTRSRLPVAWAYCGRCAKTRSRAPSDSTRKEGVPNFLLAQFRFSIVITLCHITAIRSQRPRLSLGMPLDPAHEGKHVQEDRCRGLGPQ